MVSYNYHSHPVNQKSGFVFGIDPLKEISKQGHGYMVDYYALGVLFYEMIVGIPPFIDSNRLNMFNKIMYS